MNPGDDPRTPALQRLATSRERMRAHLHEASSPHRGDGKPNALMGALMSIPGAGVLVEAVRGWWSQHPLHLATLVAADATRTMVRPLARRNPFVLIAGALVVGGLVLWLMPWRGFVRPALLAGLLPQSISRAVAHVPMESWISALLAMATQRQGRSDAPDGPDEADAAQASPEARVAEPGAVDSMQARSAAPHQRDDPGAEPRPPSSALH
jgi:hypothetical protein